jgi:hypothetical protein
LRERWWGSTGRRVPEICIEEELELEGALVVSDVSDLDALKTAFDSGRPVAVRADAAEDIRAALARPEVNCVIVPKERQDLRELDLTELTYGK